MRSRLRIMELLSSFRTQFKEITRDSQGPCLRLSHGGTTLEAGYFIFGTAERVYWLKAELKDETGHWSEAFRWPAEGKELDWTALEERFSREGLRASRGGSTGASGLSFETWLRSRLERIHWLKEEFARHPWAYEAVETECVLDRVRPALESFLTSEILREARPLMSKAGISEAEIVRIRQEHPEALRHEILAYLDALQVEKRLLARGSAQGGRWSEAFGEFLGELENGDRKAGKRRPEDFEDWWRDSGVHAALIAAAPEIPDEALKRALRSYPI